MKRKNRGMALVLCATLGATGLTALNVSAASAADAKDLAKALAGKGQLSADMDLNRDGRIDARDLTLLKQTIINPPTSSIPDLGTEPTLPATMYSNFRAGEAGDFFSSDGWSNGSMFNCGWYDANSYIDGDHMTLKLDKDPTGTYAYASGEFRTNEFYGYGKYECSMQAAKNDGIVSSFFTYTGESDNNPWDEIDIEILGKDTTKVQFNYFTNGQGNHEYTYDLGFDASEGYHTYGFDWEPDHITWYVDGKAVYTANQNIPSTPGKIMMNLWPGIGVDEWLKPFNGKVPLEAHYQWVTYHKSENGNTQPNNPNNPTNNGIKDLGTEPKLPATMYSNFRANEAGDFFSSDGWTNGNPFDCYWTKNNSYVKDGMLTLKIDQGLNNGKGNYTGGEFRTNEFYGYGYYECSMQAIKNDGVVSSFFTYTGESDNNPWDEIDIEILGKDTTKVQFNYYTNGQGEHEYMYSLGFDASEAFHTYGFDWQPDHITWYVDGKAVYTANQNIPKTPGKIMMNAWPGTGVNEWLAPFNGKTPLEAHYQWVTYHKSENGNTQPNNPNTPNNPTNNGIKDFGTQPNTAATMYSNFRANSAGDFFSSDGWTNGDPFDCYWTKNNSYVKDGMLTLKIDQGLNNGKGNYTGGEFRTNGFYHYGYYECSMQAIKNDGVVSSFFTYTGPSDDNPWDEIDIEILGKDTTKVQLNYYKNGKGEHEFMYDLGFDASEGFHTYGFDWQPNHITWYVDGKEAHTMWGDMPSTPGKIMMNVWPGKGVPEWLNNFNGRIPLEAHYQWVTYNKQ